MRRRRGAPSWRWASWAGVEQLENRGHVEAPGDVLREGRTRALCRAHRAGEVAQGQVKGLISISPLHSIGALLLPGGAAHGARGGAGPE